MTENLYNIVNEKLKERNQFMRSTLQRRFAHTTPYGQTKLTNQDLIKLYDGMQEQDWYSALDKHGKDKVEAFRQRVEALKGGQNA